MNKRKALIIASLFVVLTLFAGFIAYVVFKKTTCCRHKNVIVFWNNTDKPLALELRFKYLKPRYVEVGSQARACIPVVTTDKQFESWDALRYIMASFGQNKYKFTKHKCLNTYEEGTGDSLSRYFMLAFVNFNSETWDCVKKNYHEKDKVLDEDYSYIVLSRYPKTASPWGAKANMQAIKVKRIQR